MPLEGTLSYLDIAHLLQVVGTSKKSGVLEIRWEEREARLYFERGELLRAESNRFHQALGGLLVQARLLDSEDLERALLRQTEEGGERRLGTILCEDFGLRPDDIQALLRQQYEQVVFDVFGWPGGQFSFHFQEPEEVVDRFHLDPVAFILDVGIQAGLLAREGMERERSEPGRQPLILFIGDPGLAEACRAHWRRRGHRVTCCARVEEVLGYAGEGLAEAEVPVIIADLVCPAPGDHGLLGGLALVRGLRDLNARVPVVLLGDSSDPRARTAARGEYPTVYVRKPSAEDLRGPQGATHFDVFMLTLGKAMEQARATAGGADAA